MPYLPGLDGLRAIAVAGVMLYHAHHSWMPGGYLGVEVFFVISGYLITLLLIGEQERTGHIDLKGFWTRRFRRLLPAVMTMMALVAVYISVAYTITRERTRGDFVAGVGYISNWYQIWVGQSYTASEAFVPLRHLWSLAVEEQFYLIWPLVMVAILARNSRRLPAMGMKLIMGSVLITLIMAWLFVPGTVGSCSTEFQRGTWHLFGHCFQANDTLYLSSVTRAGGLMLGAGFAMLWRPLAIMRGPLRDRGKQFDVMAGAALLVLLLLMYTMYLVEGGHWNPWLFRGGFLFVGLLTLVMIAAVTHQGAAAGRLLGNKAFLWVGTRSYGLYLYHWPVYQIIRKQAIIELSLPKIVLAMLITVPITEASYRFIETPIRKNGFAATVATLKQAPQRIMAATAVLALLAVTFLSLVVADPHCVGAQDCVQAAAAAEDTTPVTEPVVTEPIGTLSPGVTELTTTTVPKEPAKYVAIGESVMVGAKSLLETAGVLVQAKEGRGQEGVKNAVKLLRESGDLGAGSTLIIQVGSNGPLSSGDLDAIMAEVPSTVSAVRFMTVHVPGSTDATKNNELIRALSTKYPTVGPVIDWDAETANVKLCSDGIHISCGKGAAKYYANLLLTAYGLPAIV